MSPPMQLPNTASITNLATYFLLLGFPFPFTSRFKEFYISIDTIPYRVYNAFIATFLKYLTLIYYYKSLFKRPTYPYMYKKKRMCL